MQPHIIDTNSLKSGQIEGGLGYQTGRGILFEYGETQDEADITRLQIGGLIVNGALSTKIGTADLQFRRLRCLFWRLLKLLHTCSLITR